MLGWLLSEQKRVNDNPVFAQERWRLRGPRMPDELANYNRRIWLFVPGIAVLLWIGVQLLSRSPHPEFDLRLAVIFFCFGLGATLLVSSYVVSITADYVHKRITSQMWEDLALTPRGIDNLLNAVETTAQIQAWRWSLVESAQRLSTVILLLLTPLYSVLLAIVPGKAGLSAYMLCSLEAWGVYVILGFIFAAYVLEPFYRIRTLVTLTMAITLRVRNLPFALLCGIGAAVLILFVQGVILIALPYLVGFVLWEATFGFFCLFPIVYIFAMIGFRSWYNWLRNRALTDAQLHILP